MGHQHATQQQTVYEAAKMRSERYVTGQVLNEGRADIEAASAIQAMMSVQDTRDATDSRLTRLNILRGR